MSCIPQIEPARVIFGSPYLGPRSVLLICRTCNSACIELTGLLLDEGIAHASSWQAVCLGCEIPCAWIAEDAAQALRNSDEVRVRVLTAARSARSCPRR
jgi:hypothetical protein